MNKKRRRIGLWIGIAAAGAVLVLLVLCNVLGKRKGAPEVTVEEIKRGTIISTVSATGELRAANQVDISAEMVARVRKLYVKEGQEVHKGQLLCMLDDVSYLSARALARANFDEAEAAYKRGQALYADSLISSAEYEQLRTAFEVAKAQLDQSEDNLEKTRIYAPISGRIVRLDVEEGEAVMMGTMNNAGTVMMTIADLGAMQARVDVDESDVASIKVGDEATITLDAFPDTSFKARVFSISYMPSTTTTSALTSSTTGATDFETILDIVDEDPLQRPGMTVSAQITAAVRDSALTCPLQAVGRREVGGRSVETVFILENGKAKLVEIKTGISDDLSIEVTEGLKPGQVIITGPYKVLRTLKDGAEVKTKKEESQWQRGQKEPRPQAEAESGQRSVRVRIGR